METLIILCTLFIIGSLVGWVIEVFFRRIFTAKKWINPGFMVGPYLPLYGFGVMVLYLIMLIPINTGIVAWDYVIKILIIGVAMTVVELIAGLIFIKGLNVKLWDYSNRWGNFKGIICPLFSFFWLVVGALYAIFINPFLVEGVMWLSQHIIYSFFVGIVIGMIIVDFCYSLHLGLKIKKANADFAVKIDEYKSYLEEVTDKKSFTFFNPKVLAAIANPFKTLKEFQEYDLKREEERIKSIEEKKEKKKNKKNLKNN